MTSRHRTPDRTGAGIFFLGYFAFEIPSTIILHKVGARLWICRVIVTWGIVFAPQVAVDEASFSQR